MDSYDIPKDKPWLPIKDNLPDIKAKEASDLDDIDHIKKAISTFKDELADLEDKKHYNDKERLRLDEIRYRLEEEISKIKKQRDWVESDKCAIEEKKILIEKKIADLNSRLLF